MAFGTEMNEGGECLAAAAAPRAHIRVLQRMSITRSCEFCDIYSASAFGMVGEIQP